MALEFEGDMFDGDRGSVMQGGRVNKRPRKKAKPRPKQEPEPEPLLSAAPYKQRILDLLLATGWKLSDPDFRDKWGYGQATVSRQIKGTQRANVLFVRRLVRLEAMYERELEAVHKGQIRMVKVWGSKRYVRKDLRPIKAVVGDKVRGL